MQFRFEQRFAVPAAEVAQAFTDPALYERIGEELSKVEAPEVLERHQEGDVVQLRVRYRFAGELNAAVRRALDPEKLTWVEQSVHDLARLSVRFDLLPDHYGDRFRSSGTYRFEEAGTASVRRSEGEVRVTTPLVGRAVERAIVSGLGEHLEHEVPVVERFLATR